MQVLASLISGKMTVSSLQMSLIGLICRCTNDWAMSMEFFNLWGPQLLVLSFTGIRENVCSAYLRVCWEQESRVLCVWCSTCSWDPWQFSSTASNAMWDEMVRLNVEFGIDEIGYPQPSHAISKHIWSWARWWLFCWPWGSALIFLSSLLLVAFSLPFYVAILEVQFLGLICNSSVSCPL
jgi:hypothetical protein